MTMASLPSKRSPMSPPDGFASPKKSKAEKKRESISRAQQWAAERKRKKEQESAEEESKKHKQEDDEEEDMKEMETPEPEQQLPSPKSTRSTRSTRSRKSNREADDVSVSEISIGSRRSSRRRTMTAKAASAASSTSKAAPRKGRKSVAPAVEEPIVEEENVPEKEENAEDDVVKVKSPTPKKAEVVKMKSPTPKKAEAIKVQSPTPKKKVKEEEVVVDNAQTVPGPIEETEEVIEDTNRGRTTRSFIPQLSVFLYAIFLQWSIAFAAVLVFCLDWFAFEFHPLGAKADYSNQRTSCALLGLWLVTIAGYSILLGAHSMGGWVLATSSVAMAKFAIEMNWGENHDVSLPSVPIYTVSDYGITVLDALLFVGFTGWFVLCFRVPDQPREKIEATEAEDTNEAEEEEVEGELKTNLQVTVPRVDNIEVQGTDEKTGPFSFIGDRVAVEKSGITHFGTVSNYDSDSRVWTIVYDAQEGLENDELNRLDVASAFRLYSKELGDRLKAMWRAHEI